MVCFAQNMIGKQRKNDGADLTALNPLYAGALEITEFWVSASAFPLRIVRSFAAAEVCSKRL